MTIQDEESAALACLAALTEWFEPGTADIGSLLGPELPERVVEFLFGQLIAAITDLCELAGMDPSDYIRELALQLATEFAAMGQ